LQELTRENHERIINAVGKVLTTTHAFGVVGLAIRKKFNTYQSDDIIANTSRIFGQGTKVTVEIALMATDSGLISIQKAIMSIWGGVVEGLIQSQSFLPPTFKISLMSKFTKSSVNLCYSHIPYLFLNLHLLSYFLYILIFIHND
jgi:hypothetical protein